MSDVLEIRRDHGVKRLFDEALDVAEALDDQRRLFVINVNDNRKRQGGLERVLGDQRDFGEVFIEVMRACLAADLFEDEVGCGYGNYLPSVGVERIFAWKECLFPDTASATRDQLAVTIFFP